MRAKLKFSLKNIIYTPIIYTVPFGSEVMSTWYGECVRLVGVAGHRRPLFGFAAVECWEDCSEVGFKYVGREGRGDRLL